MIHVALETSSRPPSLALGVGDTVRAAALGESRRHASDLLPTLSALLKEQGVAPGDVDLVSVGVGPGSYTGLRVGIATALGLARGAGAAVVSVPSVAAMAYGALEVGQEGMVLLDARARELYVARYRREEHGVLELVAPSVTTSVDTTLRIPSGPTRDGRLTRRSLEMTSWIAQAMASVARTGARTNKINWKRWGNRSTCTTVLDTVSVRSPIPESVAYSARVVAASER